MEQITEGLFAAPGRSVNLCAGPLGWVMVDQNLTGDHGGGRELGWAPGPLQFTACSCSAMTERSLCSSDWCCRQVLPSSTMWCPSIYVLVEQTETLSSCSHQPTCKNPACSGHQLDGAHQKGGWEGRGQPVIHYVLQTDQSASLWKLSHKLLWTWFRRMEGEKAIIPQMRGYRIEGREGCSRRLIESFL